MCTVILHVPSTESKVEPIRDNDQNSLCSCTGKNKMTAISSGARAAAFDLNNLDPKRKLLVILMMSGHPLFFSLFRVVRPTQIFAFSQIKKVMQKAMTHYFKQMSL